LRTFRVEDDVWEAAQAVAADRDETVSQVLRRALKQYIAANTNQPEERTS
jgi:predicted transcriptional regulator